MLELKDELVITPRYAGQYHKIVCRQRVNSIILFFFSQSQRILIETIQQENEKFESSQSLKNVIETVSF